MPAIRETDWAHQALGIAKVVFYSVDMSTAQMIRSENSLDVLGLCPAGLSSEWLALIVPEDRDHYRAALASVTPSESRYELEYRMRHSATGRHVWVLDRGEAEFDGGCLNSRRGAIIDISARFSIEREFRKAARLRSVVLEAGRMAAWHRDAASGRFTCTDELLVLLDIDRKHFDGSPGAVEQSIHPDDRDAWRDAYAKVQMPGGRLEIEFRVLLRQGGTRWLLSRGEIVNGRDGLPLESFGVMIDITERKSSEEAAARLAAIVESSEDAIISKSLRGIVTSWNKAAERLFGYSAEEMVGESVWRLIPDHSDHEEIRILDTVSRGESIQPFESVRLHKSGRPIHLSISVSPIRNARGMVVGASTIARDITERRRQNELLRENEARLRLALRSARAGAWNFDLPRRELHWSNEMYALYGLDPVEGQPAREDLIARIAPAHRKRAQADFARAMLQGGSFTLEFPVIRPDGSEIWMALAGEVITDSKGRPIGARGINQDITERKSWEKRQAILLRELSHRVRNTLAVIQSVARQTLRSSSTQKDFVDAFEGRIRSLAASHSLLTEADWRGAKLDVVIRNQVSGVSESFGDRFRLRGPEVLLTAEMATQLGLVLHELATNAAKHGSLSNPGGRVDIAWSVAKSRLRLTWRETGGPEITEPPDHVGFGTVLITSSALKAIRRFARSGLICRLELAL